MPPHWMQGVKHPTGLKYSPSRTHHFEEPHVASWKLDLKSETNLGLAPADWSVSSKMDDERPNGKSLFDARFHGNAMGRARGGYSMMADARTLSLDLTHHAPPLVSLLPGWLLPCVLARRCVPSSDHLPPHLCCALAGGMEATAGKLTRAENLDSNWFATDMADETAAAATSAELNKLGNNTNLDSHGNLDLVLANMSQLQRRQMDKDGDGQYSAEELKKAGISF